MPPILARHQVLILPSECEEALARSIQEGMAMGLLAIGTTTGGSGELLVDRETGLAFETGNAEDLASQIGLALDSPEISMRLAWAGQNRVKREFDISLTIQKIENHLSDLVDSARADHDGVCL
jgi:glycogen(starch) synthase